MFAGLFFIFKVQSSKTKVQSLKEPSAQSIEHKAQRIKVVSPEANRLAECASTCPKLNNV
jgi:hypothetical protein